MEQEIREDARRDDPDAAPEGIGNRKVQVLQRMAEEHVADNIAGGTQNWTSFGRQNDAALVGKMIVSPEVIVEAAGPLGDAPSRPIKAFYNLCGYDPSEE